MKKILLFIVSLCMTSLSFAEIEEDPYALYSFEELESEPVENTPVSEEEMAALRLLCNKELILSFLSDENFFNYFYTNAPDLLDKLIALEPALDAFQEGNPTNELIFWWCENFRVRIERAKEFKEIVSMGANSAYGLFFPQVIFGFSCLPFYEREEDPEYEKLQIEIFGNWLAKQRIIPAPDDLLEKILAFSFEGKSYPSFLLVQFVASMLKEAGCSDISVLMTSFIPFETSLSLSEQQYYELGYIFAAPKYQRDPFSYASSLNFFSTENFAPSEEEFNELYEITSGCTDSAFIASREKIKNFLNEHEFQEPFERKKIISLFLDSVIRKHPEHKLFFSDIKSKYDALK